MNLKFDEQQLFFDISNSTSDEYGSSKEFIHYSGIGLKNVQRRLDLVYPGKHQLEIEQQGDCYRVSLRMSLQAHRIADMITAVAG